MQLAAVVLEGRFARVGRGGARAAEGPARREGLERRRAACLRRSAAR